MASASASFTLPDAPEMSDPGLPMMAGLESSAGSGGGAGGGSGGGIGTGNGTGTGPGSGPGVGKGFVSTTPFGSKEARSNALKGYLYDFKQSPDGKPTPGYQVDMQHTEEYTKRVAEAIQRDFRESAFKGYFKAPDALYLTQLAVPITAASEGPKLFGGEGKMQPSGWLAHYHGKLKAPKAMNFRFVAFGDDCVIVKIKGQTRMIAAWPPLRSALFGRWQPSDPDKEYASPWGEGWKMTIGDWINPRAGEIFDIDIAVGECPGGHVSFLLLVEEKKETYAHGADGRPILPIFTTEEVTQENRARIDRDFAKWGTFDWDKVVVFGSGGEGDRFGDPLR
ncbi:hypothetical protein WKV53_05920 [Luteolibacter sp. Y139]|uniref:Uncharacterized protein n=1 Tax=Luteolibacter soli TaxID=3135280 RepID=A0ABU9AQN3_9BACT